MKLVLAAIVCAAAPAAAEPCHVVIAHAPDDVRDQIETWVRAEPRCSTTLEVRVVPMVEGGLYLYSIDGHGLVRERVVPDGQTAGALVASWIADDSVGWVADPGPLVVRESPVREAAAEPAVAMPRGVAITASAYAAATDGPTAGLRFDVDVPFGPSSPWVVALAAGIGGSSFNADGPNDWVHIEARELRGMAGIGRLLTGRLWQLRLHAGGQMRAMLAHVDDIGHAGPLDPWVMSSGNRPAALYGGEVGATVYRKVGAHWSLAGGLAVGKSVVDDGLPSVNYPAELSIFAGLKHAQ